MSYNRITLSFSNSDESLFRNKYFIDSLAQTRLALILATILYGMFGYLDILMFPEQVKVFHIIRYLVVIPIFLIVFLFSFTEIFKRIWQFLLFISFIVGGLGISIMIFHSPENYAYYTGLVLIFFAGYLFIKIRFFLASVAGWFLLILYNIGAIYFANASNVVLINSNFFFISANIIGMFAAYNVEYQIRRNYLLNKKLDDEKLYIEGLNKNLERIVEERTEEVIKAKVLAEENESQFRMLFESAVDAIFIANEEDGVIIDVNQSAERLMKMPKNKIVGLHQTELHPQEVESYASETFIKHQQVEIEARFKHIVENKVVCSDGTEVPVEILAFKTIYKGKKCLVGTFRDVTERKRNEGDLLLAKEASELLNANLTAIIEGTTKSIWAFNRNYEILYINQVFKDEFFMSFGVHLDPGVNLIDSLPEIIRPLWKPRYDKVLANEQFTIEDEVDTEGGKVFVQVAFNPIVKNGKVVGGSCFGSNITSRKLTEIELVRAKEQAEESDRLKSAFLANMSHEIRTPMNGILGFSSLLQEANLSGEKQQKYIQIIKKSGMRMLNIINDIVDISKIEAGLMDIKISETNINEQIEYVYIFFKPEAENKGLKLSFKNELSANEAILKTDSEKLYAVLTNLVKNAIKYTNQGTIDFGYIKQDDMIKFYVKDTGIGIPKDQQFAIFERFIQADKSDLIVQQGAGLGLSISKAFLEMLGGKIWVESKEEKGSSFYFTLPYEINT